MLLVLVPMPTSVAALPAARGGTGGTSGPAAAAVAKAPSASPASMIVLIDVLLDSDADASAPMPDPSLGSVLGRGRLESDGPIHVPGGRIEHGRHRRSR